MASGRPIASRQVLHTLSGRLFAVLAISFQSTRYLLHSATIVSGPRWCSDRVSSLDSRGPIEDLLSGSDGF